MVVGGGPLLPFRLHKHVQRVELREQRTPPVFIQEAFNYQKATTFLELNVLFLRE